MPPQLVWVKWRRRRDSSPRDPFESNGFQDRRIQPLCHSSGLIIQQFTKAPLYILEILRPSAEDTSLSGRRVLKPQITGFDHFYGKVFQPSGLRPDCPSSLRNAWNSPLLGSNFNERPTMRKSGRSRKDRKSTRLNSSHGYISYAVFCLKKKINIETTTSALTTTVYPLETFCVARNHRESGALHMRFVLATYDHLSLTVHHVSVLYCSFN